MTESSPSIKNVSEDDLAFRRVERLSRVREQASTALRQRLVREGFSEEATDGALDRAIACGLIDDMRFADAFMRSRVATGHGRYGIEAELSSLGIVASDVPGWPEAFIGSEENEVLRAIKVLELKPPDAKNLRDAAYRRLMRKGFSASSAFTASRLWTEEHQTR